MLRVLPLLLAGFIGCNDYEIHSGVDGATVPKPALEASPEAVFGVTCGAPADDVVTVTNVGDAELWIDDILISGDWTARVPNLPFSLLPEQSHDLTVSGTGPGTLVLTSNDPKRPEVTIPLDGQPDAPPVVTITSPIADDVIPVANDLSLRATVSDDLDTPETLTVSWSSDVDGDLGQAIPLSSGASSHTWTWPHATGEQTLTASVTDSCGNVGTDAVAVCQQEGFLEEEIAIDQWTFEGSARWDAVNDWLELTSADPWLVGTAFETSRIVPADQVELNFQFFMGEGTGADGFSVTALDLSRMSTTLGGSGCGIGYGGGDTCTGGPALPGWTLEVDTFHNPTVDQSDVDHLAFSFDGDLVNPQFWVPLPEMEDTGWHDLRLTINAPHVVVEVDGVVYVDDDYPGFYGFDAWIGFTAGTGGDTNAHRIDSLQVTELVCGI